MLKKIFTDRKMAVVFALGFSSGLPLLLTGSTLQAWCKDSGLNLSSISLFALVGIPYTVKFLWAPFLDHYTPPFLGRRRGWLLITQLLLTAAIASLGFVHPADSAFVVALVALAVTFFSASQDIAIDAYQIEILDPEVYAFGNQLYVLGYRIGMIVTGSGALILADHLPWHLVYLTMAGCMSIGILTTLIGPEPINQTALRQKATLRDSVWLPMKDFFSPSGSHQGKALWILAFFLLYKIGGDMATGSTTLFYMDLGYSKSHIGEVAKVFGVGATICGGIIGATAIMALGLRRSLWTFGVLQGLACLSFAWLSYYVHSTGSTSLVALASAISIENLAAGLGTAAYGCYMATLVNRRYTATQYALLTSLMGATRVFGAAPSGWIAQHFGWSNLFVFCAVASIPGLLILLKLRPPQEFARATEAPASTAAADVAAAT